MCPRVGLPPLLSSLLSAEYNWLCWASSANTWAGFTTKYERDLFTLSVREWDSPRNRTWAKESGWQRHRALVTSFLTSVRVSHRAKGKVPFNSCQSAGLPPVQYRRSNSLGKAT